MLVLELEAGQDFNESNNTFIPRPAFQLRLEHSLVALAKWESKWEKPFLSSDTKTKEETLDYVGLMSVDQEIPNWVLNNLDDDNLTRVNDYISAKMTATWINEAPGGPRGGREVITAELIYFWMISHRIPVEFQHWHLNRLIMLIRVCNQKNQPEKKMSKAEAMNRHKSILAQRRAESRK